LAATALCSAIWGVLNAVFSPIFFRATELPFLCDIIGFSVLIVASWWIRKIGALTLIGLIATIINFVFNPAQFIFLGFTAASAVFDLLAKAAGYERIFRKPPNLFVTMVPISIFSAAVAGYIIGSLFMAGPALANWGGPLGWAAIHAVGGLIGGLTGTFLIIALESRKINPETTNPGRIN
jgi:hypothetical protein